MNSVASSRCVSCGLEHPLVRDGGRQHCPNPLCTGLGNLDFYARLGSYQKVSPREQHLPGAFRADPGEWVEKAMAVPLTDPLICAKREECAQRMREKWPERFLPEAMEVRDA